MQQDWVDGSGAPMGTWSGSSPNDDHSVSFSHGIQLPQQGDLRFGKGCSCQPGQEGDWARCPGTLKVPDRISWSSACRRDRVLRHPTTTPALAT